jgi:very-short-patch-repair endonuclease
MGRPYHIFPVIRGVFSTMVGLAETDGWHSEDHLSPAEVNLAAALYDAGINEFEQQKKIGRYIVDFWFPAAKLVIEIDGRRYHTDAEREHRRSERLLELGAKRVIHITAASTFSEPDECVRAIRHYLAL